MLRIHNTLTDRKEEFTSLKEGVVNMYTCGVTVYDHCHIGHGRSLHIFEIIRRYLTFCGFKVNFVRNITDVDDKIIKKSNDLVREKGLSLQEAFEFVRQTYIESYHEDLNLFHLPTADFEPKATDNIDVMIDLIECLISKGIAYVSGGDVYFSVRKFPNYGILSGKKIDELLNAVRIESDLAKRDPLDFALWKKSRDNEPCWDSPWGKGRPGWHIECSAMVRRFLGDTIDIHGGGRDLVFPHHENEIAQSQACTGKPFARYWVHHGLVTINNQKMSKSLGNFVTLKEFIRKYSSPILKIIYLSSHYSNPLDFSDKKIKEAKRLYERIEIFIKQLQQRGALNKHYPNFDISFHDDLVKSLYDKFVNFMKDDFNFVAGFSVVFELIPCVVENISRGKDFLYEASELLKIILYLLGFDIEKEFVSEVESELSVDLVEEIEQKIKKRARLRKEKKFREADKIRDELSALGIVLQDQPDGTTVWYKK